MMSISHAEYKPTIGIEKNYLLVKCNFCAKDMTLTEGSIIFGNKWYHENCFSNLNSEQIFVKESKIKYDINMRTD
ncbi:MAG: hypothetical protein EPO37_06705 [Nitrosarchaeum sp.]|nr:MAG: hypothetical protein EPO37_06705 [Nitrosarchaeum sp.]